MCRTGLALYGNKYYRETDMILRMPDYCRGFKCSADRCSDSCCIGWEIDIDEKTADYYMNVGGEFGERLKRGISKQDCFSFILENERCPFLNKQGLCDIILTLGEDKLCHICAEHPRYYEWFDGVTEGGVGLCCEEAARLILTEGGSEGYWEREVPDEDCTEYDGELYGFLFKAREKMLTLLRGDMPLKNTVSSILCYAEEQQSRIDNGQLSEIPEIIPFDYPETQADIRAMTDIFGGLEPIDERWKPYVSQLREKAQVRGLSNQREEYIRNIGIYFLWRYFMKGVFDEEILSKVKLSVIAMAMISLMLGAEPRADLKRCAELAKNFSKETEYSEENLESLYDMTYTEQVFSSESLAGFFE